MARSHRSPHRIAAVRRFNRFYTRKIGVLQEGLLQQPLLAGRGARALRTRAARRRHRDRARPGTRSSMPAISAASSSASNATACCARAVAARRPAEPAVADRPGAMPSRRSMPASRQEVGALLAPLPDRRRQRWSPPWARIETLLGDGRRHGALAAAPAPRPATSAGSWPGTARSTPRNTASTRGSRPWSHESPANSSREHDPARERCWIAERDGVNVGSVFLVRKSDDGGEAAPAAGGAGGARSRHRPPPGRGVHAASPAPAAIAASRYGPTTCSWPPATIYQQAGFRLVASQPHRDFGPPMVGEDWALTLR